MKVFIDLGSNVGQTVKEVMKKKYNFDKIYCFEPSSKCFASLEKLAASDNRITICKFGLGLENSKMELFETGLMSASILKSDDNISIDSNIEKEEIEIVNAAEWVKNNLSESDINVAKINVEGSEIDILRSWLDSDCINIFYNIVIMFDIRNFRQKRYLEGEIRKELNTRKFYNFCDADDIIRGETHEKRINNWLSTFGLDTEINEKDKLKKIYAPILKKFSKKSGKFYQVEASIKQLISYKSFPEYIKKMFRLLKKIIGRNKESNPLL